MTDSERKLLQLVLDQLLYLNTCDSSAVDDDVAVQMTEVAVTALRELPTHLQVEFLVLMQEHKQRETNTAAVQTLDALQESLVDA